MWDRNPDREEDKEDVTLMILMTAETRLYPDGTK
jgi:hypothetical protein